MKMSIGSMGGIQNIDSLPDNLSIVRFSDRVNLIASTVIFIIACVYVWYGYYRGEAVYSLFPFVTLPLFVCGGFYLLCKKWLVLAIMAAVIIVVVLLNTPELLLYILIYVLLGAVGTAALSNSIQRYIFFKIVCITEKLNIKQKLTIWDKVVAFLFNISPGLDTRNIKINCKVRKSRMLWKDMVRCVLFCLSVSIILGMYLLGNPAFMQDPLKDNVMLYLLSIVVMVPVVVIPWFVFRSLNVSIGSGDNVFRLYDGLMSTLYRMTVPLVLLFIYMLISSSSVNLVNLFLSIICSASMVVVVALSVYVINHIMFEYSTMADINAKWTAFHPVELSAELNEKERSSTENLPGTPARDEKDIGNLIFNK